VYRLLIGLFTLLTLVPSGLAQPEDTLPSGAVARLGEVRYRHVGRIFALAFSPDGKTLAAGGWDGSLRLWDVATRKELRQFVGHLGWIQSVAFSPDGKLLASAGKDKIIRVWETATGKELHRLMGHKERVQRLEFSPDGKMLASRDTYETFRPQALHLWDVTTGRELRQIGSNPYGHAFFRFFPAGKTLAYVSDPQHIVYLDLATDKEVRRLTVVPRWSGHILLFPDGKLLVSFNYPENKFRVWDTATGIERRDDNMQLEKQESYYFGDYYLSPDGRSVAAGGQKHQIQVWEWATRLERCRFRTPDNGASIFAFSPDGRLLAQGSEDVSVLLWDLTGRLEKGQLRSVTLSRQELSALWNDLAQRDAVKAHRAMWTLTAAEPQSLPFLKEHLRPVAPLSPDEARTIAQRITDLDSERFDQREEATRQLEKWAERAEPSLRWTLEQNPPLEMRQRIDRLLEKVNAAWQKPTADCLRTLRALEMLEHMNTLEAGRFLQQLADGMAEVELTRQAKAGLKRLAKR